MLTGTVRSWAEKNQAVEAAWASPHVTEVDNRIVADRWDTVGFNNTRSRRPEEDAQRMAGHHRLGISR